MDVSHMKWSECIEKCWWLKCGIKRKEEWVLKLTSMLWGHWSTVRKHWGTERTGLSTSPPRLCGNTECVIGNEHWTSISNQRERQRTAWWHGSRMNSERGFCTNSSYFYFHVLIQPSHQRKWAFFSSSFYTSWMFYIKRLAKKRERKVTSGDAELTTETMAKQMNSMLSHQVLQC